MARDASVAGQSEEHDIFQDLGQGHTHEGFYPHLKRNGKALQGFKQREM